MNLIMDEEIERERTAMKLFAREILGVEGGDAGRKNGGFNYLGYLKLSGIARKYSTYFNPFDYQERIMEVLRYVPPEAPILVDVDPNRNYQSNIYAVRGLAGESLLKKDREQLRMVARQSAGFPGLPSGAGEEITEDDERRQAMENGLALLSASCIFRSFRYWPTVYIALRGQTKAVRIR